MEDVPFKNINQKDSCDLEEGESVCSTPQDTFGFCRPLKSRGRLFKVNGVLKKNKHYHSFYTLALQCLSKDENVAFRRKS